LSAVFCAAMIDTSFYLIADVLSIIVRDWNGRHAIAGNKKASAPARGGGLSSAVPPSFIHGPLRLLPIQISSKYKPVTRTFVCPSRGLYVPHY